MKPCNSTTGATGALVDDGGADGGDALFVARPHADLVWPLEGALAHNFALKDAPVFQLVKARVLQTQGEHAEALALLQAAYALPGVRAADGAAAPADLSEHDRCSIHLHLAEVHRIARSRRHEPAPTPSSLPAPASAPRRSASHLAGPDRYGRCTRRCRSRRRRRP